MGRQWIGVDIGDEAISTITERFKNGSKPIGDYVKKKMKSQTTMDLFENDEVEISSETLNKGLVTYDLFTEK